jgi:hypothetical protein
MPPAKKLQVFVSSTYNDLREERQAAVEAILTAGHIPAGMELFTAGDESQMDVIRRWIDESDVFLLILGGRYGSLEPTTGKRYIHLEYEYASEKGMPLFAVVVKDKVLDERVKTMGRGAIETDNPAKLREFRGLVLSKISEFWSDHRDIQLTIHKKLSEYSRRSNLAGWIPGNQAVNAGVLAQEIARLTKENMELRSQVAETARPVMTFNGLTYSELSDLLRGEEVDLRLYSRNPYLKYLVNQFGNTATLLDLTRELRHAILAGVELSFADPHYTALERLVSLGVLNSTRVSKGASLATRFELTDDGRKFMLRLVTEMRLEEQVGEG